MEAKKKATNTAAPLNQNKDKYFKGKKKQILEALYHIPMTALMVEAETGINKATVNSYLIELRKSEDVNLVGFGICPISNRKGVKFFITNPLNPMER